MHLTFGTLLKCILLLRQAYAIILILVVSIVAKYGVQFELLSIYTF